jgi:type II secretory pathway component PulC
MAPELKDKTRIFFDELARKLSHWVEKIPPLTRVLNARAKTILIIVTTLMSYLLGDLGAQFVGVMIDKKFPKPKVVERPVRYVQDKPYLQSRANYEAIVTQNLFCPGCVIPDIKSIAAIRPKDCSKAKPMSQGGIRIVGTIVLSDPKFSVVTLADGGAETTALKAGDRFKQYGKVFEIRRNKICFERDDGILQAVEIPEETFKFGQPIPGRFAGAPTSVEGITRTNENDVQISKTLYQEKITDPSTLMQAHAEAVKDASGAIRGFKILSLAPGSVFESLGFQPEDIIVGANGEPVNSLARAQELYATAASTTEMSIEIERGGQRITKSFKVK